MAHKRLYLRHQRARSLHRARHYTAARALWPAVQHKCRRILHLHQPFFLHLEYTDFIGRAKTVLHTAQNPVRGMPVTLKIEHRIHHMFQYAGTGNRSLFRHVPHNKDGHPHALCKLQQNAGGLAHL